MLYGVIVSLIALVLFLSYRLYSIRREMRRLSEAMKTNEDGRNVNVDFVDRELQSIVLEVNRLYERVMRVKVERSENEKGIRETISSVSHDMKTPLTSIIGYLQLAQRSEGAQAAESIATALERAQYLNGLVNDFFDISVIDSDSFVPEPEEINICEMVCEEIFALSPAFDSKGIVPVFDGADDDIRITADKKMLRRVIQNLLSNCVKYSAGKVTVTVERSDKIVLKVSNTCDTVIDTDRMFEKYYRGDPSRTGGGAGLGMYICKRFVEAMNGTVSASMDGDMLTVEVIFFY